MRIHLVIVFVADHYQKIVRSDKRFVIKLFTQYQVLPIVQIPPCYELELMNSPAIFLFHIRVLLRVNHKKFPGLKHTLYAHKLMLYLFGINFCIKTRACIYILSVRFVRQSIKAQKPKCHQIHHTTTANSRPSREGHKIQEKDNGNVFTLIIKW
jgi:hypothetical protein